MSRFERHVFICTNRRPDNDPRGCCAAKGSEDVRDLFKKGLKARGLGKRIRANAAGCLDACATGVTVVVYPEGVWYGGVTAGDVEEIIERHLVSGQVVERLLIPQKKEDARIERNLRILEQTPANHLARFGLANAYFDAGRLAEAEQQYRLCLQAQPDWMAVAISLGRCLVMRHACDEARPVLAAAREMARKQGHSSPLEEIAELEARCAGA